MNPYSTHQLYKDVIPRNTIETATSAVILCADFPKIQFTTQGALKTGIGTVVGTFVLGETVTGGTSAATGKVLFVSSTVMIIQVISGTFQNAETITGGTSAATAVLSSPLKPSFTIKAYTSNNDLISPPNPTLPVSPTNQYEQVMYTDDQGGVNYDVANPFTEGAATPYYTEKSFRMFPKGAIWCFLVFTYTSGALAKCDIQLFNN